MNVEIVSAGDPLILVSKLPASCTTSRKELEHEAGRNLLQYGMALMKLPTKKICTNNMGKPFFESEGSPFFSISHSSGYVACAISKHEIGCDIERIKHVPCNLDTELRKVSHLLKDEVGLSRAYDRTLLWTIYEAVAKCIGKGIPLHSDDLMNNKWLIRYWIIESNHILTIALSYRM